MQNLCEIFRFCRWLFSDSLPSTMNDIFVSLSRMSIGNRCGQGCQVGPFGNKFQKFGPKSRLLAPHVSFGPLALFWPFFRIDMTPCKNYI